MGLHDLCLFGDLCDSCEFCDPDVIWTLDTRTLDARGIPVEKVVNEPSMDILIAWAVSRRYHSAPQELRDTVEFQNMVKDWKLDLQLLAFECYLISLNLDLAAKEEEQPLDDIFELIEYFEETEKLFHECLAM
jgi:hypothetical protein